MINMLIDEEDLLDMLMERVQCWKGNDLDLWEKYYEKCVYGGYFNGAELDIKGIVDNDCVNWFTVLTDEDDDFQEYLEEYKNGNSEKVEVVSDDETRMLVRY